MIDGDNLKNGLSNIGEQVGELLQYISELEKENAELSNSVTELTNSKTELENKVTELEKQIEKMKCCGNCSGPCWNIPIVRKFECLDNNYSLWRLMI